MISLSAGTLRGLFLIHKYRFLGISQFAKVTNYTVDHAREVLRNLEARGALGYFGYSTIPGHGRTPKLYFLKRRGFEYLRNEGGVEEEELGRFVEAHQEITWSPQMYHRLRLLDLFIALETQVGNRPHLELIQTLIEYRRVRATLARETADYVAEPESSETRIVPDGAFVLENTETGRRGLFLVEMDMGTERIAARYSADRRATVRLKFEQYDRYLSGGRFAQMYAAYGEFRSFTLLFVTYGDERIENIRASVSDLESRLHPYYRLTTYERAIKDFLGLVWKSRDRRDRVTYALIQQQS